MPIALGLCLLLAFALSAPAPAQPAATTQKPEQAETGAASIKLRWTAKPRVKRYRLQVALDSQFTDIIYDQAVVGLEQEVSGLQPGKYYWRVAPATNETGRYSAPVPVEAKVTTVAKVTTPVRPGVPVNTGSAAVMRPPTDVGWQAAIGAVARPFAARLRAGRNFDLVALNSDGVVFALDGSDGTPLWSSRSARANAQAGDAKEKSRATSFMPLVYPATAENKSVVVVTWSDGVRGLDGESGREMWRTAFAGRVSGGAVAQLQGERAPSDFVIATSEPNSLYVLDWQTGRIVSKTKLGAELIGAPIPFTHGEVAGVALASQERQLEIRRRDGSVVRAIKFDVPFTTPPLVLATPLGTMVVIGTNHGLLFFDGAELKPLGRISTEQDAPRGRLTAADMDNDGMIEIVMVTQNGRVAVISTAGKVSWASEGASDAYMATFANLNNDGVLDVVVASGAQFAVGYSGRDGTLIWRADDKAKAATSAPNAEGPILRSLTGALSSTGAPLLVGGDAYGSAVRAVGLPIYTGGAAVK